ncbi:MAG: 50S ribosomal protein L6 [bacterium]|nr:50S ribosomal protein L6 [bacterium]
MSRVGNNPIVVPEKVKVQISGQKITVGGPLGELSHLVAPALEVLCDKGVITLKRREESDRVRASHGLNRNLINNMVIGVSKGFEKELEINGVGYRAEVKGSELLLTLGFSHPVNFQIPKGIKVRVDKQTRVFVTGSCRHQVGEVSAIIRKYRPVEPYKGKGIRYAGEIVRRKVGKAAVGAGGGK